MMAAGSGHSDIQIARKIVCTIEFNVPAPFGSMAAGQDDLYVHRSEGTVYVYLEVTCDAYPCRVSFPLCRGASAGVAVPPHPRTAGIGLGLTLP